MMNEFSRFMNSADPKPSYHLMNHMHSVTDTKLNLVSYLV